MFSVILKNAGPELLKSGPAIQAQRADVGQDYVTSAGVRQPKRSDTGGSLAAGTAGFPIP